MSINIFCEDRRELRIRRTLFDGQQADSLRWKQFSNGPACGLLFKHTPGEVAFLLCGNRIVAGPDGI